MKAAIITVTFCLALITGALAFFLTTSRREIRQLGAHRDQLDSQLAGVRAELEQLHRTNTTLAGELEKQIKSVEALTAQVAQARAAKAQPAPAEVALAPAQRVRTFLGREYLGQAWLVSSQAGQDPKTGRKTYEPAVVLDESLRRSFTVYETNIVERPVNTSSTVNYNYVPPRTYYYPVYYPPYVYSHPPPVKPDPAPPPPVLPAPLPRGPGAGSSPWGSVFLPISNNR